MANPNTADAPVINVQPADVQVVNTPHADVDRAPPATVATIGIY